MMLTASRRIRALSVLGLKLAFALSCADALLGCRACERTGAGADAAVITSRGSGSLTPELAAKVLAKVGDKVITLADFVSVLERMDQFDRLRYQSAARRKELLEEMINIELLAQEAVDKGYDKEPAAQAELRQILRDAMLAESRKSAVKPGDVPAPEVRAYYDAHRADYRDPERRRVSVILVRDDASAQVVLKQIKPGATAAEWGELVRRYSLDPLAKASLPLDLLGDMGIVSPPGDPRGENTRVPEPVRVALFTLNAIGDVYSSPVHAGAGAAERVYVVRLVGKTEARDRAFEEAERVIRVKLAEDLLRASEKTLLSELRKEFAVQIDDKALAEVRVQLAADLAADAGKDGSR
jgi:peptidyl-prolyl cis-trans isomerase C